MGHPPLYFTFSIISFIHPSVHLSQATTPQPYFILLQHGVLPQNYGEDCLVLKNIFEEVGVFFILRQGEVGQSPYGETCQNRLWRGNLTVYLFFYFIIMLCFHMSVLLYRNIVFQKFEHGQIIMYIHSLFVYFEYDGFLN